MWMYRWLCLTALCVSLISVAEAAGRSPYYEATLPNGLNVILKEDHRSPTLVVQVWYHVGSSYEGPHETGLSHALEHMMFGGTPQYPSQSFSQALLPIGAYYNAETSHDHTCFFTQLSKEYLPLVLKLEADRMQHLVFDPAFVKKEMAVVMEERRLRTEDNIQAKAYEQFQALGMKGTGYEHPVVGWMADLESYQTADLKRWYQHWYHPNNATLVIVGDLSVNNSMALIRQYFGPIAQQAVPTTTPPVVLPERRNHTLDIKVPGKLPLLFMGYPTPSIKTTADTREAYTLELISSVLAGGPEARLHRHWVTQNPLAAEIHCYYSLYQRGDTLFTLSGIPNTQRASLEDLEKAMKKEIEDLKNVPITEEELQKHKIQYIADKVFEQDSLSTQAKNIGFLKTLGLNHKEIEHMPKEIQSITPADIQKIAKKYFKDSSLTLIRLYPESSSDEE